MWRRTGGRLLDAVTAERLGVMLAILGVVVTIAGQLDQYGALNLRQAFRDLYANIGTDFITIALTVLLIDRLNRRREARQFRERLIREMGSRDNGTALRAVDELRARGWLADGSLVRADLKYANLEEANLADANLEGAYLTFAILRKADLRSARLRGAILRNVDAQEALLLNTDLSEAKLLEADLRHARMQGVLLNGASLVMANLHEARGLTDDRLKGCARLQKAVMPNGTRYDGRYNLAGDLEGMDPTDVSAMAAYYEISADAYQKGQAWAQEARR